MWQIPRRTHNICPGCQRMISDLVGGGGVQEMGQCWWLRGVVGEVVSISMKEAWVRLRGRVGQMWSCKSVSITGGHSRSKAWRGWWHLTAIIYHVLDAVVTAEIGASLGLRHDCQGTHDVTWEKDTQATHYVISVIRLKHKLPGFAHFGYTEMAVSYNLITSRCNIVCITDKGL